MVYRIVQWTTGNVGARSVRAIVANPDYELVGCYAWSPDKAGRDVGELCGLERLGVLATNDVDALLALRPDCVVYNPLWADVDEMVRILDAGVNVVSTAAMITGHSFGAGRDRLAAACERGRSTLFGSGINPGLANLLAIVTAQGCDRIDKIIVTEMADSTFFDSPSTEQSVGFGRPIDDPALPALTREATAVFADAVRLLGDALGVEFDEIRCDPQYAQTTAPVDLGSWTIAPGCVSGVEICWSGILGGEALVELRARWRKGRTLEPDWALDHGYRVEVRGQPTIITKMDILPPPDFKAASLQDYMVLGMIITAMPAVNAIPAVVAAPPGIATYNSLPVPGLVRHRRGD